MDYFFVAAGFTLLLLGGEFLVRGAVALARRLGVSPLVIGLTIVAYGTSAPELLISLEAHLTGASGIAIGNVVGSNIANILLIVGCAALIYPVHCAPGSFRLNGPMVLGSAVVLYLLGLSGGISPWAGAPMLAALVLFTVYSYRRERGGGGDAALHVKEAKEFEDGPHGLPGSLATLVGGLAGVVFGSRLLIAGAVDLARDFGVSEATIGLTLVAVGTSLPELATAVVAAVRRHADVALGNVLGSNIFNTLGIMGIVPLLGTVPVPTAVAWFDLPLMLGVTVAFVLLAMSRGGFGRILGALSLLLYGLYIASHYLGISALAMPAA